MKNKIHNQVNIINYIVSTERFKVIFIMTIILALYGSVILGKGSKNFIDAVIIPFQFSIFNIFMFSLLFLNTFNTYSTFDKHFSNYIIRLESKNNYLKEQIKNTIILNVFYLILFFLLFFIFLNLSKTGIVEIHNYNNYNVNNLVFTLFYLIRYVVYALLITTASTLLIANCKLEFTVCLWLFFLSGFILNPYCATVKDTFSLNIWNYFGQIDYSSFMMELSFSILFGFLLELIIYILYKLTLKNKKMVIT